MADSNFTKDVPGFAVQLPFIDESGYLRKGLWSLRGSRCEQGALQGPDNFPCSETEMMAWVYCYMGHLFYQHFPHLSNTEIVPAGTQGPGEETFPIMGTVA